MRRNIWLACLLTLAGIVRAAPALVDNSWDLLRAGLAEGDPDHRRQALTALEVIGSEPRALSLIESSLRDKNPVVRQTAAALLGELKAPSSIPFLRKALEDTPEVSFTAAGSLWAMGDRSGAWILEESLMGERSNAPGLVTGAIRDAQHEMHNPGQLAMMGIEEASGALLGPASMGIVAAKDIFKDTGAPGRAVAALLLASDPDPYALTLLEWALGDSSGAVRAAAAKALATRGNRSAIGRLEPLLHDQHHAVRYMAAAAIIRLSARPPEASAPSGR